MNESEVMALPSSVYSERLVLGCVVMNSNRNWADCSILAPEDFSLEKHRRIFVRMREMSEDGVAIDHVTLTERLMIRGELEIVGGLAGVIDLEDGMPEIFNLKAYVQTVIEKSKLRRVIYAAREAMNQAFLAADSSETLIRNMIGSVQDIAENEPGSGLTLARDIIDSLPGGIDGLLSGAARRTSISTGFSGLDKKIGGLDPGQLIIIGGRPGMGKTALAMNIAQNIVLREPKSCVSVFSLEMSKQESLERMIASGSQVDLQRYRCNFTDETEQSRVLESAGKLYESAIMIDDSSHVSLTEIRVKIQRQLSDIKRDGLPPLKLIIVDYLQLMPVSSKKNSTREQEIAALSRGLKLLAKEAQVPVMALSQLSRAVDQRANHEPILSDLRESGAIEQDADVILFPFRPEVYSPDREDLRGVVKLIIAKQRNGPTGIVRMVWLAPFTRFVDCADEWTEEN